MLKISKAQMAFKVSFVGPRLTGAQRMKSRYNVFQEEFIGPAKPEHLYGHRRRDAAKKAFYESFVGPIIPVGTPAYWKFHAAKHYRRNTAARHANAKARKAAKAQRAPWRTELDEFVFEEAYALLPLRKEATGIEWHVDHMLPFRAKTVSGLHVGNNIAVIPAVLNCRKGEKLIFTETGDWLRV